MLLIRATSRVRGGGNLKIPGNIIRQTGIKENQVVELRIIKTGRKRNILITFPTQGNRGAVAAPKLHRGAKKRWPQA